jgi:hypothetical protein
MMMKNSMLEDTHIKVRLHLKKWKYKRIYKKTRSLKNGLLDYVKQRINTGMIIKSCLHIIRYKENTSMIYQTRQIKRDNRFIDQVYTLRHTIGLMSLFL